MNLLAPQTFATLVLIFGFIIFGLSMPRKLFSNLWWNWALGAVLFGVIMAATMDFLYP